MGMCVGVDSNLYMYLLPLCDLVISGFQKHGKKDNETLESLVDFWDMYVFIRL